MLTHKSSLKAPIASLLLLSVSVQATDFNWNAAVNGNWGDTTKWSPSGAPSVVGDNATISATGSAYEVSLEAPLSLGNLTLDSADATLDLGAFNLTVRTGVADVGSGTIIGSGGRLLVGDGSAGNIITGGPVFRFGDADIGTGNVVITRGRIEISGDSTGVGTVRVDTAVLNGDIKSGQVLELMSSLQGILYSPPGFTNSGEIVLGTPNGTGAVLNSGINDDYETVINNGTVRVSNSTGVGIQTNFVNNGTVMTGANGRFYMQPSYGYESVALTFTNNGNVTVGPGFMSGGIIYGVFNQDGGTLDLEGYLYVAGTLHLNGGNIITQGAAGLSVWGGGTLAISANSTATGTVVIGPNGGGAVTLMGDVKPGQTLDMTKYGDCDLFSATGFTNGGEIHVGAGAVDYRGTVTIGSGALDNTGTIKVIANRDGFLTGDLTNNGNVLVETGGEFTFDKTNGDYLNNADFTIIGKLVVRNTGSLWNGTTGTLRGTGTVEIEAGSSFTNAGTIAPGLSPGTLTIMGDVPFENTASLEIELGGISNYDMLHVLGGDVFLDGMLEIALINGFTPGYNDIFTILMADSITGAFDNISGNTVSVPGGAFEVVQSANQLQLIHYVPEPASGLLMLLGSTAFALRRKRPANF